MFCYCHQASMAKMTMTKKTNICTTPSPSKAIAVQQRKKIIRMIAVTGPLAVLDLDLFTLSSW